MRYWSLVLCLALTAPRPSQARVCQDLRTGPDSFIFARDTYNCAQLLTDRQYTPPASDHAACPPGYYGTACKTPCPAAYSLVLNTDDPRRCGCYAPAGCDITTRPVLAAIDTPVPGVALIPDDATQAGRIVFCDQQSCDPAAPSTPKTADVFACEDRGIPYRFCPRCPKLCGHGPHARCTSTLGETCAVACAPGYYPDHAAERCVPCQTCAAPFVQVAACDRTAHDTRCQALVAAATPGTTTAATPVDNNATGWPDALRCPPGQYANASTANLCRECPVDFAPSHDFRLCWPCPAHLSRQLGQAHCVAAAASCPPDRVLVEDVCMACAHTHAVDAATQTCAPCPRGFLQDAHNATQCVRCPVGTYLVGAVCTPCDIGDGMPCAAHEFRDDCTEMLPQNEPCECACRSCPLLAAGLSAHEEIRDCRVECVRGFHRSEVGGACVSDASLVPSGVLGEYFFTARNSSDTRLFACEQVVEAGARTGYVFGDGSDAKLLLETVLVAQVKREWQDDVGIEACRVRCAGQSMQILHKVSSAAAGGVWGWGCA